MPLGAKIARDIFGAKGIVWPPEARAFYTREFADASVRTSTAFANAASVPFYAESGNYGRNSGRFGVGLNASVSQNVTSRIDYDYKVYDHTTVSEFGGTLAVRW